MNTVQRAFLAVLIATLLWGATPPIAKFTFDQMPVFTVAFLRFVIATLIFFPLLGLQDRLRKITLSDYPRLALLSLLGITLSIGLFFWGLSLTTAAEAGIIISTGPLFNSLAAKIFLKEKLSQGHLVGTILASFGTAIIVVIEPLMSGSGASLNILGNSILLLAVLAGTGFNILSKESFKRFDATTIIGFSFLFGSLSFLPFALWEHTTQPNWVNHLTIEGVLGLVYLGLFSSIAAYFLYEWAIEKISVTKTLPMTFLQPAITILIAIPLLGEKISLTFVLGSIFILIGMFLATMQTPHHHQHSAHHKV